MLDVLQMILSHHTFDIQHSIHYKNLQNFTSMQPTIISLWLEMPAPTAEVQAVLEVHSELDEGMCIGLIHLPM